MYQEIMSKVKELVGDDEAIAKKLYPIITELVFETLFTKLAKITTVEELETYSRRMEESKSPQHLQTIINEIVTTVYGENAVQEFKNEYFNQIDKLKENMDEARNLIEKSKQGDPEALQKINQAKNTKIYQRIADLQSST